MNQNVFEIEGLECAYENGGKQEKKVVLRIESLAVPMGKVSIILGQSGSGKSTLIETLGLMNQTIHKGLITYYHAGDKVAIGREIWKHPSDLSKIRNRHFSFIFQNDFLMPYYSSEENMLIGKMIRDCTLREAREQAGLKQICKKMGLDFEEITRKKPAELSVGQRQRLSFIRAMLKDSSVIFGDEPTGNLDDGNSELLMDVLTESVKKNTLRAAILVSHNLALSIAKADNIIVISQSSKELYEVLPAHVFSRTGEGWLNGHAVKLTNDELAPLIRDVVDFKSSFQ
jgi:ABC-type lipoprotein export system ATPase subunit